MKTRRGPAPSEMGRGFNGMGRGFNEMGGV